MSKKEKTWSPLQKRVLCPGGTQTGHIIKVHLAACLAGCSYGLQCWMCCLAYLSWSPSALFIPFLWGILSLNTPGSLFSQYPACDCQQWLIRSRFSLSHGQCTLAWIRNRLARYFLTGKVAENAEVLLPSSEHESQKTFWTPLVCLSVFSSQYKFSQCMHDSRGGYPIPKLRLTDHLQNIES